MSRETQRLHASVDIDSNNEKHVKIVADEWTPDYEGLTDAVEQEIDIYQLSDRQFIGEATFDKDADRLRSSNVDLNLDSSVNQYRW